MTTSQILALVLTALAAIDIAATIFVIAPRLPEKSRPIVIGAATATALIMVVVAGLLWVSVIDFG